MRYGDLVLVVCALAAAVFTEDRPRSPYGFWVAETHGQRSVELSVREVNGKPEGTIAFILLHLEDGQWVAKGRTSKQLLAPVWKGGALLFEVEHAKKHGSAERGSNVRFRFESKDGERALLRHEGNGESTKLRRLQEQ